MRRKIEASSDWIVQGAKLKNKYGTTYSKSASEIYSPVLQSFSVVSICLLSFMNVMIF